MSSSTQPIRSSDQAGQTAPVAMPLAWTAGKAWWDLMTGFQRDLRGASPWSLSSVGPRSGMAVAVPVTPPSAGPQVISVGEERLNVTARTIQGETTRIRRRVVTRPVEQEVTLRDEKVIVERRPPTGLNPKPDMLTETVVEMSDSHQVPTVWKTLHVSEELVLRRQVTERVEKVREMIRHDVVDVEHTPEVTTAAPGTPAVRSEPPVSAPPPRAEADAERKAEMMPAAKVAQDDADRKFASGPVPVPAARKV